MDYRQNLTVADLYREILKREPESQEVLDYWASQFGMDGDATISPDDFQNFVTQAQPEVNRNAMLNDGVGPNQESAGGLLASDADAFDGFGETVQYDENGNVIFVGGQADDGIGFVDENGNPITYVGNGENVFDKSPNTGQANPPPAGYHTGMTVTDLYRQILDREPESQAVVDDWAAKFGMDGNDSISPDEYMQFAQAAQKEIDERAASGNAPDDLGLQTGNEDTVTGGSGSDTVGGGLLNEGAPTSDTAFNYSPTKASVNTLSTNNTIGKPTSWTPTENKDITKVGTSNTITDASPWKAVQNTDIKQAGVTKVAAPNTVTATQATASTAEAPKDVKATGYTAQSAGSAAQAALTQYTAQQSGPIERATTTDYNAISGEVDDNSLVNNQLKSIIDPNSDYMRAAALRANQDSNRRGLLNSSMAVGAGQLAAIQAALPIATADAKTYSTQRENNQMYANDAAKTNAAAANSTSQFNAKENNYNQQFNVNQLNTTGIANMNAANKNSEFNANATNQRAEFDTGWANNALKDTAGWTNDAALQNARETNATNRTNAGLLTDVSRTNATNTTNTDLANVRNTIDVDTTNANAQNVSDANYARDYNAAGTAFTTAQNQSASDRFNANTANRRTEFAENSANERLNANAANVASQDFTNSTNQSARDLATDTNANTRTEFAENNANERANTAAENQANILKTTQDLAVNLQKMGYAQATDLQNMSLNYSKYAADSSLISSSFESFNTRLDGILKDTSMDAASKTAAINNEISLFKTKMNLMSSVMGEDYSSLLTYGDSASVAEPGLLAAA